MNHRIMNRGQSTCSQASSAQESPVLWDGDRLSRPHVQPDKADRVREMFDAIAPTYEQVNTVTSVGRDAAWRRQAVAATPLPPEAVVLDVACGTGDLARAFLEHAHPALVVGTDFAFNMLRHARPAATGRLTYCRADALRLPFPDGRFDAVSCAFGVRNFQDLAAGLGEFARVLKPGGKAVILEFALPANRLLRKLYLLYFRNILPRAARLISRDRVGAYRYLPQSVISFLSDDQMAAVLADCGFADVRVRRMTFGVVSLFIATKPAP